MFLLIGAIKGVSPFKHWVRYTIPSDDGVYCKTSVFPTLISAEGKQVALIDPFTLRVVAFGSDKVTEVFHVIGAPLPPTATGL